MGDVTDDELLVDTEGGIRVLTINRPDRLNALSVALFQAITDRFVEAEADGDVRVIVLTAVGTKAFSAGADLREMAAGDANGGPRVRPMRGTQRWTYEVVLESSKPTIAAINGVAVGGGCEIALACDLRVASAHASFCLPEAKRGLGSLFGSIVLPRRLPYALALEAMYTGEPISAARAAAHGLVNHVVEPDELMPTTMELARKIERNAPLSVRRMKAMASAGASLPIASALRLDTGPDPYSSGDRVEGVRAFVEKRAPRWTNS